MLVPHIGPTLRSRPWVVWVCTVAGFARPALHFGHLSRSPGKLPTQPDWAIRCKASFPTSFAVAQRTAQGGPEGRNDCEDVTNRFHSSRLLLGSSDRLTGSRRTHLPGGSLEAPRRLLGGPPEVATIATEPRDFLDLSARPNLHLCSTVAQNRVFEKAAFSAPLIRIAKSATGPPVHASRSAVADYLMAQAPLPPAPPLQAATWLREAGKWAREAAK